MLTYQDADTLYLNVPQQLYLPENKVTTNNSIVFKLTRAILIRKHWIFKKFVSLKENQISVIKS